MIHNEADRKKDAAKPASYLVAHDVVVSDHAPSTDIQFYMARLREWWNRAGSLPALALNNADYFGMIKVLEFGASKYEERGWESGILYHRVFRAASDHYAQRGGLDSETRLPHRHHFLCCYMFLAAYTARGLHQFDDRPGVGPFVLKTPGVLEPPQLFGIFWASGTISEGERAHFLPEDYSSRSKAEQAIENRIAEGRCTPGNYEVEAL